MPGTSLAIAKLTFVIARSVFTRPSEKTAKFTFGGLLMTTAGTPAFCSTVKEAESLVEVSFAGEDAALSSTDFSGPDATGGVVTPPLSVPPPPPPPQPATASVNRTAALVRSQ